MTRKRIRIIRRLPEKEVEELLGTANKALYYAKLTRNTVAHGFWYSITHCVKYVYKLSRR